MPDTGAPWNIPYVAGTDLVRDWPTDSQDLAEAIADGLDAALGIVSVQSALFTGTQTSSVSGGSNLAVTNLSITHTLAAATNKLIISAYLGTAATSEGRGGVGLQVYDGATLIGAGAAASNRSRVVAGGIVAETAGTFISTMPSATFVYEPGDTSSHTYAVYASNINGSTRTLYINRTEADTDSAFYARASSALVIQEVQV